jgi:hypothetical protein
MTLIKAQDKYLNREVCYTDYPLQSLGDLCGKNAPMRRCYILKMPTDKYAELLVTDGDRYGFAEVKIGYIKDKK